MMLCKGRLKTEVSGFQTASSFVKSQIETFAKSPQNPLNSHQDI